MQTTYEDSISERQPAGQVASWLDRPLLTSFVLSAEIILFIVIMVLAIASRSYDLEPRVMSHDENSHVYYSWLLYKGQGYSHDPITHGPFQFHVVALSYFLFGDSDTTARIPAVLFSIATVAFTWYFRRYLGRVGALVAAVLFLISPYMLFYGRYVRNEAFVGLWGLITLWSILRYLETGRARYMFFLTAATVLHFTTKETAFIYTAQALLFLGFYFVYQVSQKRWPHAENRNYFLIALMAAVLLVGFAGGVGLVNRGAADLSAEETLAPAVPGQGPGVTAAGPAAILPVALAGLAALALLAGVYFLIRGYTWKRLMGERSFDLLVILSTMVLPMLAPFPVKMLGINPIAYNDTRSITITAIFAAVMVVIAIAVGLLWKPGLWLLNAALFYGIFTIFYTTVFTNGFGFVTGLVGSLGYWLEQQGVNRGSQPWYYYWGIQVPIYEFLPALGALLGMALVLFRVRTTTSALTELDSGESRLPVVGGRPEPAVAATEDASGELPEEIDDSQPERLERAPVLSLLIFWSITSVVAYTIAGEKMPWLTYHIALPMILLSGWSIGYLIETTRWDEFRTQRGWLVMLLLPVFLVSFVAAMGSLLSTHPPFQGKELAQLRDTSLFLTSALTAIASGVGLAYLIRPWSTVLFYRALTLAIFAFLAFITARTAIRAAYINYDNATEFLVYAHSAGGVKEALAQIEELSRRTAGGTTMAVAYDNQTSYPYWWYLRNYPNQQFYGENPTRSLREVPAILVGDTNYSKIEPVVRDEYYQFDYTRLWWPTQDYFDLTWERIAFALSNPAMREAIFQIWWNRDYKLYGEQTNKDMSLPNWYPSTRMRLYIRKDVAAKIWNYGVSPSPAEVTADPYEGKGVTIAPDLVIGSTGSEPGQLNGPRDLAVAPDGSIYVADTNNHRIQHFSPDGSLIKAWGSFADVSKGEAPGGTFYEPWGIALGPDGSVYVADTWNYRIQKFTADGAFVKMWGYSGQAEAPEAFWGPRDVEVDTQGRVLVTDTGNKRIVIFDGEGNFISQFGSEGLAPGEFAEPVGISVDADGSLYVADTWNQRIQVFTPTVDGSYAPSNAWDVSAWFGQSLGNKPYIDTDGKGNLFVTDPESYRVLQFTTDGQIVRFWGDYSTGPDGFGLAGSVSSDPQGGVWVSDTANGRLLHFTLPEQ